MTRTLCIFYGITKAVRNPNAVTDVQLLQAGLQSYFADKGEYPTYHEKSDFQQKMEIYLGSLYPSEPKSETTEIFCYDDAGKVANSSCNTLYGVEDSEDALNALYKLATNLESQKHVQSGGLAQTDGGNISGRYELFAEGGEAVEVRHIVIE